MSEPIITKTCRICNIKKSIDNFYKNKRNKDGFFHECKSCHFENGKNWRNKNKDYASLKRKETYENDKEKNHNYTRAWRKNNPDLSKQKRHDHYIANKDRHNENCKAWNKNNKFKRIACWINQRAKKFDINGKINEEDIISIFINQKGLCNACSKDITNKFTVDHIVTMSKGGENTPKNIQLLCHFCNSSKADKDYNQFLIIKGLKKQE